MSGIHDDLLEAHIPKKICNVCGNPIPVTALMCKECKSHLTWRRYLHLRDAKLAISVALLTIAGSNLSKINEWLFPPDSRLIASFQTTETGYVIISASNSGSRPGGIGQVYFHLTGLEPPEESTSFPLIHNGSRDDLTIESLKTRSIGFNFNDPSRTNAAIDGIELSKYRCALSIQTIQFSGRKNFTRPTETRQRRTVDCHEIVSALHPEYYQNHSRSMAR